MQRQLLTAACVLAVFAGAFVTSASADVILATDGDYQLSITDPVPVGDGSESLLASILQVTNTDAAADFQLWPVGFSGSIGGALHHEQFSSGPPFFNRVVTPTATSAANSSVDSHLLGTIRVTINPPNEPAVDETSSDEPGDFGPIPGAIFTGFGGPLTADVAFADANNPAVSPTLSVARLVASAGAQISYSFQSGSVTEGRGGTFEGNFILGGTTIDDIPPIIDPILLHYDLRLDPPPILEQLLGSDNETAVGDLVWSDLVYDSGPGKNFPGSDDPGMDGDGVFDWNPSGWRQGVHNWSATVADLAGNTTTAVAISVDLWVPEPATASLVGLALVGMAGFVRRRS